MSPPATPTETLVVRDPAHAGLLDRFYDELYLPAFSHQREPLDAWLRQLWGEAPAPYELSIVLAGHGLHDPPTARLRGGILSELYPRSGCGLITYLVVAPDARRGGLGRALLDGARRELARRAAELAVELRAVFSEVSDPRSSCDPEAWHRLERFQRWGARVVDHPYVQPRLGAGLARDPALRLIAFFDGEPPASLPGSTLAAFLRDFFLITEGIAIDDDPELRALVDATPAAVPLRAL